MKRLLCKNGATARHVNYDGQGMGSQKQQQSALFYEFCIEDQVPANHLLRSVDRFVDLDDFRKYLAPYYSDIGRPSVDPE